MTTDTLLDPKTELRARLAALRSERDAHTAELRAAPRGDQGGDQGDAHTAIGRVDAQIRNVVARLNALDSDVPSVHYTVEDEDGQARTYTLVHPEMSDPANGLVSPTSPIGRALSQAQEGDSVTIRTPRGDVELVVLSIASAA